MSTILYIPPDLSAKVMKIWPFRSCFIQRSRVVDSSTILHSTYIQSHHQQLFEAIKNLIFNISHTCIHTYIVCYYNSSVRIMDLVCHTTYVVCVNFIQTWAYSLKTSPNDKFFKKLFMAILLAFRVFTRNLLRGNQRRNIFSLYFCFNV